MKKEKLSIAKYQKEVHETTKTVSWIQGGLQTYIILGLAEEAGEVCGKFAKAIRDDKGHLSDKRKDAIKKELGDVCWFVSEIATDLGLSLEDVMQTNLDKLYDRQKRNVIGGSGDER